MELKTAKLSTKWSKRLLHPHHVGDCIYCSVLCRIAEYYSTIIAVLAVFIGSLWLPSANQVGRLDTAVTLCFNDIGIPKSHFTKFIDEVFLDASISN